MRSLVLLVTAIFGYCAPAQLIVANDLIQQEDMHSPPTKRVAIIGAGAAGSSAAYHLRKYAGNRSLNITIFERDSYVGGRSTTVNAFNLPSESVELGASIFVDVNTILVNAAEEFDLELQPATDQLPTGYQGPTLGIWNGDEFVFQQNTGSLSGTWDYVKLLWRYGLSPLRAQNAVKETVGTFLRMYDEAEGFPWEDLTEEVQRVGLLEQTSITGIQLLEQKGVTGLFGTEIIQAAYVASI
jgi:prenylcysteine oxidase/farnesylcysteine lyase